MVPPDELEEELVLDELDDELPEVDEEVEFDEEVEPEELDELLEEPPTSAVQPKMFPVESLPSPWKPKFCDAPGEIAPFQPRLLAV